MIQKTSNAFIASSWVALGTGVVGYLTGLVRATMLLNEKGYYFTVLMFGLFAVVSLQKSVRDRLEGFPVTDLYYGICWFATLLSILLLTVGLWNATLLSIIQRKRILCLCVFIKFIWWYCCAKKHT